MLVLISFSKLAIFTFVIINIGYFIFHYSKKCRICTISRFTLLLVVAAIFLSTHADPLSLEKRITLFTQGFSVLQNNPLFGTGFGHHLYAQAEFPSTYAYFFLQPVHNIFILFAMQAGAILSVALLFLGWKHLKKNIRQIRKYGGYTICVLVLTGSGDHYWLTLQQNLLLLGVVWGLMIGQKEASQL
jgi:O-antigen ligase